VGNRHDPEAFHLKLREAIMSYSTRNEIEYLSSIGAQSSVDLQLIQEMSRRLDALRRYDQYFCAADWMPEPISSRDRRQFPHTGF
jgi:hypothetical protein